MPPLESGDHLTAQEFERRYAATAPEFRAELIEGVVYVASPVSDEHGASHADAAAWIGFYRAFTPGLISSLDGTVRLDTRNRPQPDIHLRIPREVGGRVAVDADGYVSGSPELIVEIARSSASYDLHDKLEAYRRNEVREYVVWRVDDDEIDWFVLRDGQYVRSDAGADGLLRSAVVPGLWLDPAALLRGDMSTLLRVVQAGVASAEHASFVDKLKNARIGSGAAPHQGGERP